MTTSPQSTPREQLRGQVLLEVQELQRTRDSLLGETGLARLALAPYWPGELAAKGLNISGDVEGVLRSAVAQQLLNSGPGPLPWQAPVYWMNAGARDSALRRLAATRPLAFIRQQLTEAGGVMIQAAGENLVADLTLWRWAQHAAAAVSDANFNLVLSGYVDDALRQSEKTRQIASPEALRWIEAAEPLSETLRGGFEAAVAAAKRRFELFYRRGQDRRRLVNYFARGDADQAFLDLIDKRTSWALHFIGAGGAGKTMLMRHISINLAKQAEVACSRIDFDYLNPEFPQRNACLLLVALAEEFRLQAGPSSARAFASFQSVANTIYQRLEGSLRQGQMLHISVDSTEFREALKLFAEAINGMAEGRHPVVMLDTCEELAKVRTGGEIPRNVADTFRILEALKAAVPDMRVVFSGRRPLPDKPYLQVHRIEEFSAEESRAFLTMYTANGSEGVEAALIPRIVDLSRSSSQGGEPRYSPYDLDTFASWVAAEPGFKARVLDGAGPQVYVKERIIDRLSPLVRGVLPALAVLGRFDRTLLEDLIGATPNATVDLVQVLDQEWMETDSTGAIETWRLDAFRARLLGTIATLRGPSITPGAPSSLGYCPRSPLGDRSPN